MDNCITQRDQRNSPHLGFVDTEAKRPTFWEDSPVKYVGTSSHRVRSESYSVALRLDIEGKEREKNGGGRRRGRVTQSTLFLCNLKSKMP